MKRERNPKVKTPWDGVVKERADAPRSGGDEPKAKSAESDITDACYLHHRKRYPMWDAFFYYTSKAQETGLEGECAEDEA